ncbi:putative acyl-CoA dehydrogenase [Aspergillus avenaceus]|uniref:Putative acyl-CoA dehydrogenase n=1 Tax=Aspergillus avenaceus TaxID=36643 RepID=A0A5N6U3R2_ASPAV|nr:putative acyl-CoA dehydrogenase [Aspergillus avenaceus]
MIDFTLSPTQHQIRQNAQSFADTHLQNAHTLYTQPSARERFRAIQPVYRRAVEAGLVQAQVPSEYNGLGYDLIDMALLTEELYTADVSVALTILGTGLGLSPLLLGGTDEQKRRFLAPFTNRTGVPLASLVHSEPGGTANAVSHGLATKAKKVDGGWAITGEKLWAANSGGWDDRGADIQCVTCSSDEGVMILLVTREDIAENATTAYKVLSHPETIGHKAVCGPHIRFDSFIAKHVIARGSGAQIIQGAFTASAALVGAMSVALMRKCFERTLRFAKTETRNGREPIINRQSVADLLVQMKMRCEAARALTWKACATLQSGGGDGETAHLAKIFASDSAVQCVVEGMNVVGVSAYQVQMQYGELLNDAVCLPVFDGGNVGVRRRELEARFKLDGYSPWAASFAKL